MKIGRSILPHRLHSIHHLRAIVMVEVHTKYMHIIIICKYTPVLEVVRYMQISPTSSKLGWTSGPNTCGMVQNQLVPMILVRTHGDVFFCKNNITHF
jgi:hypothetical protein